MAERTVVYSLAAWLCAKLVVGKNRRFHLLDEVLGHNNPSPPDGGGM